jgi:hypothetical protein
MSQPVQVLSANLNIKEVSLGCVDVQASLISYFNVCRFYKNDLVYLIMLQFFDSKL